MNRTVICNIPMKLNVVPSVYKNVNRKLEVSEREVRYPVNALLEKNLTADDNVTALLLVKKANYGDSEKNTQLFIDELNSVNESIGAKIEYKIIETAFEQDRAVYEELLGKLVDEIKDGESITADITYGPKDVPIIVFYALSFAEKFLDCDITNIVYGQSDFDENNNPYNTRFCDMLPLFVIGSVTNNIQGEASDRARELLEGLISF